MKTVYLILAFCVGLFTGYLLFQNGEADIQLVRPHLESGIKARINAIDTTKAKAENTFRKQNDLLKGQLLLAGFHLKQNRDQLLIERNKIAKLKARIEKDTTNNNCKTAIDSLVMHVDTLTAITDSVMVNYENKIGISETLIAVRDSQIVVCNQAYNELKDLSLEQARREQQLTEDLNSVLKQQRKKRFQNRLLAAGMFFISGVTTSLVIKSRQ